jgi:hypothetical protein
VLLAYAAVLICPHIRGSAYAADPDKGSFGERVVHVASDIKYPEVDDEIYSHPLMKEMFAHADHFIADAKEFFFQHPELPELQARVAMMALQCASLDEYLKLVDRLSGAARGKISQWVLFYSIAPGFEESTRLAMGFHDKKVRSVLMKAARSPNATPNLRQAVREILDGTAAGFVTREKWVTTLKCNGKM